MAKNSEQMATLLVLAAGILWGTMGLFVRPLTELGLSSLQIAAGRFLAAGVIYAIILTIRNPRLWRVHVRDIPLFLGLGIVSVAFFTVCYFTSIQMMSMSTAAILLYTSPIWVMLMSIAVFKEKLSARKVAALVLAFAGCVCVSGLGGSVSALGVLIGLGSGIGYALYSIIGTFALRKYDSLTVTTYAMLIAGVATLLVCDPASLASTLGSTSTPLLGSTAISLAFLVAMGIVTAAAPYLLYTLGLKRAGASRAAILATIEPITATILGTAVFGEALTALSIIGIVCVVAAIVILNVKKGA